jgi:transcriptional regulator with XRE-family HTH domain
MGKTKTENFWKVMRRRRGLSQEALARKAGVSAYTVRGWESGRSAPSLGYAAKAGDALGMSAVGLLVGHVLTKAEADAEAGEVDGATLLKSAARFLQLAGQADDSDDSAALLEGAEVLVGIASGSSASGDAAMKSSADGGEGLAERDAWGRSVNKLFGDQALHREASRRAEKGAVEVERDGYGRAVNKLYGGTA